MEDGFIDEGDCLAVLQCPYQGGNNVDGTQHGFSRDMIGQYGDLLGGEKCHCSLEAESRTVIDIECVFDSSEPLQMSVTGLKDISLKIRNSNNVERIKLNLTNAVIDTLQITNNAKLKVLDTGLENLRILKRVSVTRNPMLENIFPKTSGLSLPTISSFGGDLLQGCVVTEDISGDGVECDETTSCTQPGLKLDPVTKAKCIQG